MFYLIVKAQVGGMEAVAAASFFQHSQQEREVCYTEFWGWWRFQICYSLTHSLHGAGYYL